MCILHDANALEIDCLHQAALAVRQAAECDLQPYFSLRRRKRLFVDELHGLPIACAGHFPEDINETYRADVRRMLPLWGKTEAEFIRDVDAMIQRLEEAE